MASSARQIVFVSVLTVSLALLAGSRPASAQEAKQEPAPPYVTVGNIEGSPGASLIVPLYYTPDPTRAIRSFTVEIEFVSNNLEFQDATKGVVNPDGLKLSSTLTKGTPDEKMVTHSRVRLSIGPNDDKKNEGLQEGLLAYLLFQLSPDAKPFIIMLSPTVVVAEDTQKPAHKVSYLSAMPGSISVLSEDVTPEMSCFFFTH